MLLFARNICVTAPISCSAERKTIFEQVVLFTKGEMKTEHEKPSGKKNHLIKRL